MIVALAAPPFPKSINDGLYWLRKLVQEAAIQRADIVCFPESFLPGYPGMGYEEADRNQDTLQWALDEVRLTAIKNHIAIIIPMDWHGPSGLLNVAHVISAAGEILGYQTKNQLDPTEDRIWVPGTERHLFEIKGVKFGITICHEGFRYPESVRWAAQNGAKIVFHPHFVGNNTEGKLLSSWGDKENPYYEKAMMMRALENTIYFASVNYTSNYPDSSSSIIAPDGNCLAHATYGKTGLVVAEVSPDEATGLLAKRFKNHLYQ